MYKIRKLSLVSHPVLGNLSLDFCDRDGKAVDTVIIAGENGVGKSNVLDVIYRLTSGEMHGSEVNADVMFEKDGESVSIQFRSRRSRSERQYALYASDGPGEHLIGAGGEFEKRHPLSCVFSDVDINFHANTLSSVTSMKLDEVTGSRRSASDLPTQVNQLLIDIQSLDDSEVAYVARRNSDTPLCDLRVEERMPRFTRAFSKMFDDLEYDRIATSHGHKTVMFRKGEQLISIDALSSGEKQVVYRGCFLLKDARAIDGAFVLIDEPEISLHPLWQMKILDYYRGIFTNSEGVQTSQLIVVTHSPFVIHNSRRRNDKVIVLKRDDAGDVSVQDRPEYYTGGTIEVVHDAFAIPGFEPQRQVVYLEGRTDERYFRKAQELRGGFPPFELRWVGYLDGKNQERNTGGKALSNVFEFLVAQNLPLRNACVFDCDTGRDRCVSGNVLAISLPYFTNSKGIKKGVENALVLDDVALGGFYTEKTIKGDYNETKTIQEFQKMKLCNYICEEMDEAAQRKTLANLIDVLNDLDDFFREIR